MNARPKIYDRAKYHYEGDFPEDLDQRQAFVHTGLYLGWILERRLYSDEFAEDFGDLIAAFEKRKITGPDVYRRCDGTLADDMLSSEGNRFTAWYLDMRNGPFLDDYEEALADDLPSTYHVADTWENYEILKTIIDRRFKEWNRRKK